MRKNKQKGEKQQIISIILLLTTFFLPLQITYGAEPADAGQYVKINAEEATLKQYDGTGQTSVTIPEQVWLEDALYQVTSISGSAFLNQQTIKTIQLPGEINVIHRSAFQGCTSLETINLPSGLTLLGTGAFQQCSSLRQLDLPSELTVLGGKTFSGCSNLQEITLPSQLTVLGSGAFQRCTSLTEISLPAGISTIQSKTFFGCSNLQRITILHETEQLSIASDAFFSCPRLREIVVPNDTVAAIVADYFVGKEIQIINLSEPENPDTGGDGGVPEPENPDAGGDGEAPEPENPDAGGDGEVPEPENPDAGGDGEAPEPENPDTGGDGEVPEPENPDAGGDGEVPEPENPDAGGDGEVPDLEEPVPPIIEDSTTESGLQWADWITDSKPVESIFKAEQGGEVIRTGETILVVPMENYAFWQWSDGCRQRARRQNFSGQEIWAQFVPVDAVVTVQQNSKKHVVSWCAVRDHQLKFRPSATGDVEKTICYDWSQPKPQFSDWQQHPYQRALQFAAQRDLLRGVESGKIAPDAPFTNAMAATVLHRLAPTKEIAAVGGDSWYIIDWQWAKNRQMFAADAAPEAVICGQDFQRCLCQLAALDDEICPSPFFAQKPLNRGEAAVLLQDFITRTV